MDRDAFLARVRAGIDRSTLPPAPEADPGPLVPDLPDVDLIDRFGTTIATLDGTLHTGDPYAAIAEIIAAHGPGQLVAWDDEHLPLADAIRRFTASGCTRIDGIVPSSAGERLAHQRGYFDVLYGLTGAEAGFAETGSIVVRSGPGRPRMASLIPLVHIVLLPRDRIVRSPMHWLTSKESNVADAANVVYVTGPSRTADIEQRIELGVHGPREVHVVLVERSEVSRHR